MEGTRRKASPGRAAVEVTNDPDRAVARRVGALSKAPRTLIVHTWAALPTTTEAMIDDVVSSFGQSARALWPAWFRTARDRRAGVDFTRPALDVDLEKEVRTRSQAVPRVSQNWLRRAIHDAMHGRVAAGAQGAAKTTIEQWIRVIDPEGLLLVLRIDEGSVSGGLASVVDWLARCEGLSVELILRSDQTESLDILRWPQIEAREDTDSSNAASAPYGASPEIKTESSKSADVPRVARVEAGPLADGSFRSVAEAMLAARLNADPELRGRFKFNQRVTVDSGRAYEVDALWAKGRVIVEVDGVVWHTRPDMFRRDRHRDYELLVSGYTVLRLPDDEVRADPDLAVQKVRAVVRFREGRS